MKLAAYLIMALVEEPLSSRTAQRRYPACYLVPNNVAAMLRILLPTDFSSNAMHAANYALQLFGKSEATYILMHAQHDPAYVDEMGYSMVPELLEAAEDRLVVRAEHFAKTTGAIVESHLLFGILDVVVEEFVSEQGADVVVMGKRGRTGSALFGSNTADVIRSSSVPVVAVPDKASLDPLHRILLAADQNEVAPANFALLRTIALRHQAEVLVTHVEMDVPAGAAHWSEGLYELALQDVPLTFLEGFGHDIADGLERTANESKAGMIAILHRHLGSFDRLFHRSLAKEMALGTELPLLVLQQKA